MTAAGYLLGAVSGSGVANTVMLGAVTWPLMRRAGYPADTAGAVLAAAGIGAILAPPVMGAAAFLIAEFLNISYLEVIVTAAIPAALYYLSIFLMVEADSRRLGLRADRRGSAVTGRPDQTRLVSLRVDRVDRRADDAGLYDVPLGLLGDGPGHRHELSES